MRRAARASEISQGGVLAPKAISKPAPSYPLEAKQGRVQGTVGIQITVDEEGRVVGARPLCGPRPLYDTCVIAARQARFTPKMVDGKPVKVIGTVTYNFEIE